MTSIVYVSIKMICFNRFQQVHAPDQAKIEEIASSILQHRDNGTKGLLQVPTARIINDDSIENGLYELAFGHHRYKAFVKLAETDPFFAEMPLIVRELSDIEMFELMAIENFQRRDISAIEEANTFHSYMTTFSKTSQQAAEKFGKTDEYVRAAVRLLNLPDEARQLVQAGKLTKTDARDLLVLKKLGGDELVGEALGTINELEPDDTESAKDVILRTMRMSKDVSYMDGTEDWFNANKKFPHKHLKPLSREDVVSVLFPIDKADPSDVDDATSQIMTLIKSGMDVTEEAFPLFTADSIARLRVLIHPSPCPSCPFHAVVNSDHFCGMTFCKDRKVKAWELHKVDLMLEKVGVPQYRKDDGEFISLDRYNAADKKLWEEKGPDLRLKKASYVWNNFEGLDSNWQVVVVGETAKKRLKKLQNGSAAEQKEKASEEKRRKIINLEREFFYRFNWEVSSLAFGGAFEGVNSPELLRFLAEDINSQPDFPEAVDDAELFAQTKKGKLAEQLKAARRYTTHCLVDRLSNYGRDYGKKNIVGFAKDLQKEMLETAGIAPANEYMQQAEKIQKEFDQALKELDA